MVQARRGQNSDTNIQWTGADFNLISTLKPAFSACLTTSQGICQSAKPASVSQLGEFSARSASVGETELSTLRTTAKDARGAACIDMRRTKISVQKLFLREQDPETLAQKQTLRLVTCGTFAKWLRDARACLWSFPPRFRIVAVSAGVRSTGVEFRSLYETAFEPWKHGHSGSVRHLTAAWLCLRGTLPGDCRNFKFFLATQLCTVVSLKQDIYLANSIEG